MRAEQEQTIVEHIQYTLPYPALNLSLTYSHLAKVGPAGGLVRGLLQTARLSTKIFHQSIDLRGAEETGHKAVRG